MNGEVPLAMKAVSDEIAIADIDTLRMPVAIAPGLASEPINAEVANMNGTVQVSELTSLSIASRRPGFLSMRVTCHHPVSEDETSVRCHCKLDPRHWSPGLLNTVNARRVISNKYCSHPILA
jgi:hypothetical protein